MSFGSPRPNVSIDSTLDEQDLSVQGNLGWPSPIVTYTVPDPRPMLRAESDTGAIVMAGDATGLNNLAGLGLLNTDSAVYYAGTLARTRPRLHDLAAQGAQLVVTDTNRKQAFRWNTLTANAGYTETPDDDPAKTDLSDSPIELFPGTTISSKTYATYVGAVNVTASSYGNSVSYTPEDRAYSAIDEQPRHGVEHRHLRARPLGPVVAGPVRRTRSRPTTSPWSSRQRATAPAGSRPSPSPSTARTRCTRT